MRNEEIIEDLFEAARLETSVRDISQIQAFIETMQMPGTHSNLIVKWLKQYKMNILLTSSTIIIATTILLFPKTQALPEEIELDRIETVEPETVKPKVAITERQDVIPLKDLPEEVSQEVLEIADESQPTKEIASVDQSVMAGSSPKLDSDAGTTGVLTSTTTKSTVTATSTDQAQQSIIDQREESKAEIVEHKIVLKSREGRASAEKFNTYLQENLSKLNPELKTSGSSSLIRKFTLKLDNGLRANFQMQVTGFRVLELHWNTNSDDEVSDVWFRLDEGEISELDLSKESKSSVKVKLTSSKF